MLRFVALALAVCVLAVVADSNQRGDLRILDSFSVQYDRLAPDDVPVLSMSQKFTDLGDQTWIETAIPLHVPQDEQWDVRAIRVDVVVGRRPEKSSDVFDFAWDGGQQLRKFGGTLHIYESCDSPGHATGKPCPEPIAIYKTEMRDASLEVVVTRPWGYVYRADVFLSRDPDTPGFIARRRVWVSFFATMPSRYTDETDGKSYDLRHWEPVWKSANEATDLAIADHADLLQRGWTDWRHGQELRNSIYNGVDFPSPGFVAVGYDGPLQSDPAPELPAPVPDPTAHHWPDGVAPAVKPPVSDAPPTGIGAIIGSSVGLGIFLILCGALVTAGYIRRRKKRAARARTASGLTNYNNPSDYLHIDDEGMYRSTDELSPRETTSTSHGSSMSVGDSPFIGSSKNRGVMLTVDDSDEDYQ